jgi:hypothetical protein
MTLNLKCDQCFPSSKDISLVYMFKNRMFDDKG